MTTRTITRMFLVVVAALAIALLGTEGDADAVKKQNTDKAAGPAKGARGATQQAKKGKKRKGRAVKRPKKKEKKPEKEPEESEDQGEGDAAAVPEDSLPVPGEAEPAGNGGSKLRKSAAGSSLEPSPSMGAEGVNMTAGSGLRQSNRMEFDARVVRGETAGSGAVILFERGPRHLAPLTKRRTRFLDETIEGVLGKEEAVQAREKRERARKSKQSKKGKKSEEPAEKKPESKSETNGKSK